MSPFQLPPQLDRTYPPVSRCIYCGAGEGLSDEHIIPFGIGGRWILPRASCANCARITGAFEGVCQRTILGPLRMYYDLPSRRRKQRPKKLPLKVKVDPNDEWTFMDVDQDVYPFLVLLPILDLPDAISGKRTEGERGAKVRTLWVRGASFRDGLFEHMDGLAAELGVAMIEPTATFSAPEFIRMLAKVAHGFAVAELGLDAFTPFLLPIIKDNDTSGTVEYVGGVTRNEPAASELHGLSIIRHPSISQDLVVVRIRLFACLGTPTYAVAVGRRK